MARDLRLRGRSWRAVALGMLTAAVSWAVGVDAGHVVALGLAATAVGAVLALVPLPPPLVWPEGEPRTSGTGWHQVALLAGALAQTDRDPDRIGATVRRLRALAVARLARHGIAWTDARARELLGGDVHDVLDGRRPPPRATQLVQQTLTALEALEVARSHDHR